MIPSLAIAALLAYLAAGALIWRRENPALAEQLLAAGALVLHGWALGLQVVQGDVAMIGVSEAWSLFSWQAAVLLWLLCLLRPLRVLGLVVYPLAGVAAVVSAIVPTAIAPEPITDWRVSWHIFLALLSAGLLTLAAVQATALFLQERFLHRQGPSRLAQRMAPLQTLERDLFQLVAAGAFLLALVLVSGFAFVHDLGAQHLTHKAVLSTGACLIFAVLLWGRWRFGWRGRTAFAWAVSGYGVLVLAYFGSKLVLEEILGRHWN